MFLNEQLMSCEIGEIIFLHQASENEIMIHEDINVDIFVSDLKITGCREMKIAENHKEIIETSS